MHFYVDGEYFCRYKYSMRKREWADMGQDYNLAVRNRPQSLVWIEVAFFVAGVVCLVLA